VYRVIRGWHLDQDQLAGAVRNFGRHVTIVDEDPPRPDYSSTDPPRGMRA
jgi:hypothetical protein